MPTNLNALLRYKVIDECLKNNQINCSIDLLIKRCSNALSESTGQLKSISERTIREDIRILRSDVLGFNAPIVFENGRYFYKDKNYSLFSKPINQLQVLKQVQELLIENFEKMDTNKNTLYLLAKLSEITGDALPLKYKIKDSNIFEFKIPNYKKTYIEELDDYLFKLNLKRNQKNFLKNIICLFNKNNQEHFRWEYIFRGI
jgi:hydroxymethylpyrimidine pyrophosphatase-like HAD family hydrolase